MINVKSKVFTNGIMKGIVKLSGAPVNAFDVPTTFTLGSLKKKYLEAYKNHLEIRDRYIKEYCKKDENGNPVTAKGPDGGSLFQFEGDGAKEFTEKMTELDNIEVQLNVRKLSFKLSTFPTGILNGDDFANLGNSGLVEFINDIEEEEENVQPGD